MQSLLRCIPRNMARKSNGLCISTTASKNAEVGQPKMTPAPPMGDGGKKPINTVFRVKVPADRFMQTSSSDLAKQGAGRGPCGGFTNLPSDDMILDIPVYVNFRLNVRLEEYEVTAAKLCGR